jgi:hypothetical protein
LQNERGCRKPGTDLKMTGSPFRFTSPALQGKGDAIMYECPVGYTLRESPWVYDAVEMSALAQESTGAAELATMPRFFRYAFRVYSSERNRLRELEQSRQKSKGDAAYGARLRAR